MVAEDTYYVIINEKWFISNHDEQSCTKQAWVQQHLRDFGIFSSYETQVYVISSIKMSYRLVYI